jgi:hypothetical protein
MSPASRTYASVSALLGALAALAPTLAFADAPPTAREIERSDAMNVRDEIVHGATVTNTAADLSRPAERIGNIPVNERLVATTAEGCRFVSTVQGRVRVLRTRDLDRDGKILYRPHVTVASRMYCPGRAPETVSSRQLAVRAVSQAQLEQSLARFSAVTTGSERGGVCTYAPRYVVQGQRAQRVVGVDVREACMPATATGGGPRS